MYSAAFSLFWPYLNRQAPVVQNTVEPSPPLALGSAPMRNCDWVLPELLEPQRRVLILHVVGAQTPCENAISSGVWFTPPSVAPGCKRVGRRQIQHLLHDLECLHGRLAGEVEQRNAGLVALQVVVALGADAVGDRARASASRGRRRCSRTAPRPCRSPSWRWPGTRPSPPGSCRAGRLWSRARCSAPRRSRRAGTATTTACRRPCTLRGSTG